VADFNDMSVSLNPLTTTQLPKSSVVFESWEFLWKKSENFVF